MHLSNQRNMSKEKICYMKTCLIRYYVSIAFVKLQKIIGRRKYAFVKSKKIWARKKNMLYENMSYRILKQSPG